MTNDNWQTVWTVYRRASELDPIERTEFVEASLPQGALRLKAFELLTDLDEGKADALEEPAPPEWQWLGRSLGRYQIREALGRGGTGDVYRAYDRELGRDVAIKCVAPTTFGASDALSDFIREARAASALNHPGIVTVYEVVRTGDTAAIVMELVEGDSLRKFASAPQPIQNVAEWGRQIAAALASCHERGIIHRDIKPENLILRNDGYVKILDFGLAKDRSGPADLLPMGTIRYMSPEQSMAAELKPATDIFSLGVVLYELAAGVHPYAPLAGSFTTFGAVQAIASHEVQRASKVVPKIPAAFDALVVQMMARDPEARPTGSEVVRRLESIRKPGGTGLHSNMRIWAAVAIVVLAVVGLWIWMRKPLTNPARRTADVRQVRIIPFTSYEGSEIEPTFSPDGKQIAFTWTGEDGLNSDIYTKAIGSEKLLRLTSDPAEEFAPAWSPDGRQIAFLRRKRGTSAPLVMVVPAGGGKALPAGEISDPEGFPGPIGWWPDSHSLVVRDSTPAGIALVRLFPGTGEKRVLTNPPNLESDGLPVLSPDGRRMAFTRRQIRGASVCLLDVETSQSRCIHHVDSPGETTHGVVGGLAWQGDGALLYSAGEAIWRLNLAGGDQSAAKFLEGTFPFLTGDPQGRRLAFSKTYSDVNIWRSSSIGKPIDKLAPSSEEESEPQYSSDGSKILFRSRRTGAFEIFTCAADGSGLKQLTSFGGHLGSASWSPDAKWIAFDGYASPTDRNAKYTNIYLVSSSSGAIRRVSADVGDSHVPAWSRDGKWIYYELGDGSGRETWKIPVEGGGAVRVADYGMFDLAESFDGRDLYYTNRAGKGGIWRRPVTGGEPIMLKGTEKVQLFRYWSLSKGGIFFVDGRANPVIQFFDFATGQVHPFARIRRGIIRGPRGLAASPDGSEVLYMEEDLTLGDILLVENLPGRPR